MAGHPRPRETCARLLSCGPETDSARGYRALLFAKGKHKTEGKVRQAEGMAHLELPLVAETTSGDHIAQWHARATGTTTPNMAKCC